MKLYQELSRSVNFRLELPDVSILNKPICACAAATMPTGKSSSKEYIPIPGNFHHKCIVYVAFHFGQRMIWN